MDVAALITTIDGPIACLKTGSQTFMLINEPQVVRDLIEKRGAVYAARPDWFIRQFNGNLNIAFREWVKRVRFF
jgi:hypothetical protein